MADEAASRPARKAAARPRVGFIMARRFTLCAFANFVDVLRLAADEGDRSRPILCQWVVLSDGMGPVTSSCGVVVQPNARLADPAGFCDASHLTRVLKKHRGATPAALRSGAR